MGNGLINRQYVGARYVPKIMGEWNKALQYEALSVVTYLGNSFTSKVPVPANIDISNQSYWVNTGNYNAQVEAYRQETAQLSNNLNAEISNRINADKDNILWIGDSYSVNYNHKLPNGVRAMLNANNWYEYSKGGAGFAGAWAGANFNDLIQQAKNEMSASQKEMIKYVYIVGGANDSSFSWTDIKPKVISTVNNARSSFPNAQVSFIFASCAYDTYSDLLTKTKNMCNDILVPCILLCLIIIYPAIFTTLIICIFQRRPLIILYPLYRAYYVVQVIFQLSQLILEKLVLRAGKLLVNYKSQRLLVY